jgi:hypothetical protein
MPTIMICFIFSSLASHLFLLPLVLVLFHTQINLKMPVRIHRIHGLWLFIRLLSFISFPTSRSFAFLTVIVWL